MRWIRLITQIGFSVFALGGITHAQPFEGGGDALSAEASRWVSEQTGEKQADIQIGTLDRRAPIEACSEPLRFRFPFQSNTRTLEVSCSNPEWKRFVRVKIEAVEKVVASKRGLEQGHRLLESDLMLIPKPSSFRDGYDDFDEIIGLTLNIAVKPNQPITRNMINQVRSVFVPKRVFEPGEPIKQADVSIESIDTNDNTFLTEWPSTGIVTAATPISTDTPLKLDQVELSEYAVVSTGPIVRGQVITRDLVTTELQPLQRVGRQKLSNVEEVIGMEVTRTIRSGELITPADLIAADLIRKGEKVTLTIQRGSLTISVDTVALENGKQGEQVDLLNSESGKTIRGVVTGRHAARGIGP